MDDVVFSHYGPSGGVHVATAACSVVHGLTPLLLRGVGYILSERQD